MVNLKLAKLLDEGRSKNRYLHTVSNSFATYVLDTLKKHPETIQQDNMTVKPTKFLSKDERKKLKKLQNVTLFFIKQPNLKNLIDVPTASYFIGKGDSVYGEKKYEFERGEITLKVMVDENLNSFEDAASRYSEFYRSLSELFRHEIEHYIDDYSLEGGLESQEKERSPYRFLTDEQKEEFNYFARPYEVKAYVKQFMEQAKRSRKPFYKVLVSYLKNNEQFSVFNQDPKLKDILYVLIYKYLEHASTVYNSVREDSAAMGYLQKLGAYLDDRGLYIPEEEPVSESFNINTFKEWLVEGSDLSKYWKKRAKSRAKRAGRSPNNAIDKNWALEQEAKSKDISDSLKRTFDEQIKESEALSKQIEEIIALQTKKKNLSKDPFVSGITGRAKGFKKKHKGAVKVAPGETF